MFHCAKKQAGIVLILVLVFMQLIAMLSWCALANVLVTLKSTETIFERQRFFNIALIILHQAESQLITEIPTCLINPSEENQLVAKPLDGWQSAKTCAGNFQKLKYYYVVEPLGDDPCASIENTQAAAAYFRMTFLFRSNSGNAKFFLQSVVIRPSDLRKLCQGPQHLVKMGRQIVWELD